MITNQTYNVSFWIYRFKALIKNHLDMAIDVGLLPDAIRPNMGAASSVHHCMQQVQLRAEQGERVGRESVTGRQVGAKR